MYGTRHERSNWTVQMQLIVYISIGQDGQTAELEANRLLTSIFLQEAVKLLSPCGEVHIVHKTKAPVSAWCNTCWFVIDSICSLAGGKYPNYQVIFVRWSLTGLCFRSMYQEKFMTKSPFLLRTLLPTFLEHKTRLQRLTKVLCAWTLFANTRETTR